jgi:hypothetical protein
MAMVSLLGKMEEPMLAHIKTIKKKDKGYLNGLMEDSIMDNGKTGNSTEKVNIKVQINKKEKVFGKKEEE